MISLKPPSIRIFGINVIAVLKHIKRTSFAILAVLLFANSTVGFAMDVHLCQGEFQSMAFFGQKAACTKMAEQPIQKLSCCGKPIEKKAPVNIGQKSCCDNVHFLQDNDLKGESSQVLIKGTTVESVPFVASIATFDFSRFQVEANYSTGPPIDPPLLSHRHSASVLQVFII